MGSRSWRRHVVPDLLAVVGLTALAVGVVALPSWAGPLRAVVGLAWLLLAPGTALVAALFPQRRTTLAVSERLAFGGALSVVAVVAVALAVILSPLALGPVSVTGGVAVVIIGAVAITVVRSDAAVTAADESLASDAASGDPAVGVWTVRVLVVCTVLATASLAYPAVVPSQGESYTAVALGTEADDGTLQATDYPQALPITDNDSFAVAVTNHEHERVTYTVVVALHVVEPGGDGTAAVTARERVATYRPTLAHGETWRRGQTVPRAVTGERVRLAYLVYRGAAPEAPTLANADREAHLWVNASPS